MAKMTVYLQIFGCSQDDMLTDLEQVCKTNLNITLILFMYL